jgi:hypothetical protein
MTKLGTHEEDVFFQKTSLIVTYTDWSCPCPTRVINDRLKTRCCDYCLIRPRRIDLTRDKAFTQRIVCLRSCLGADWYSVNEGLSVNEATFGYNW